VKRLQTVRGLEPSAPLLAATALLLALAVLATPIALAVRPRAPRAHASVIGGRPAAEGAYPSSAYVLDFRGKLVGECTGTVVAPSLVLTAGHCAEDMKTGAVYRHSGYRVLTGRVDFAAGQGQLSNVVGVIPYPGFARHLDAGDAALLVLEKPVSVPAMPLARRGQARLFGAGTTATIAGWGLTSISQRKLTRRLRYAHTVVQPASWCKRHVHPFFPRWELCTIDPGQFAAGGCYGDSGGPLMVPSRSAGELLEVGVVAFGQFACSPRYPNVYTRVDALSSWLRSWIAAYGTLAARAPSPAAAVAQS
jgi:secreted trypsin-like serine protease